MDDVVFTSFFLIEIYFTTELIINREELPISGTMLRALMIQDKRREWMTFVNPKLHKMYDEIRSELMESIMENEK